MKTKEQIEEALSLVTGGAAICVAAGADKSFQTYAGALAALKWVLDSKTEDDAKFDEGLDKLRALTADLPPEIGRMFL